MRGGSLNQEEIRLRKSPWIWPGELGDRVYFIAQKYVVKIIEVGTFLFQHIQVNRLQQNNLYLEVPIISNVNRAGGHGNNEQRKL